MCVYGNVKWNPTVSSQCAAFDPVVLWLLTCPCLIFCSALLRFPCECCGLWFDPLPCLSCLHFSVSLDMVPFTMSSSPHSQQTLLMLYRRMGGMTSTAGCVTARARCSAVSSARASTTPSASNWPQSLRATGSVQSARYWGLYTVCQLLCHGTVLLAVWICSDPYQLTENKWKVLKLLKHKLKINKSY